MATRYAFHFPSASRRGFLTSLLAGFTLLPRDGKASEGSDLWKERAQVRHALRQIRHWGCQYQNANLREIAASQLDLVIIDLSLDDYSRRFVTTSELALLKRKPDGGRRLVLAYLCVGETDTKRWYWPQRWRERPPEWVGPVNPAWPGSHHVRFWEDEWQSLVFRASNSILDRILETGFDGALLDRVDAYLDWADERPTCQEEMIDLVADLADKARKDDPDFILLPQNGELLLTRPPYLHLIDALNKESLLTGLDGEGTPNKASDIEWSLNYLRRAKEAGILMLATEYLTDRQAIAANRARLTEHGFLPFFGVRELDRLPEIEE